MYLFFDVSAAGPVRNWNRPANDPFNWPRLVHLSWLVYNQDRELIAQANDIIKPEGWTISEEVEEKHKITPEMAENGVPLKEALERFSEQVGKATFVVAHNMKFNSSIVGAEFYRKGMKNVLEYSDNYCLMQEATWFCKIPGRGGKFKWPTLQQLHTKIFAGRFANNGEALADVSATVACAFALVDLEAIEFYED